MISGFIRRRSVSFGAAGSVTVEVLAIEICLEDHCGSDLVADFAPLVSAHSSFEERRLRRHRRESLVLVLHGQTGRLGDSDRRRLEPPSRTDPRSRIGRSGDQPQSGRHRARRTVRERRSQDPPHVDRSPSGVRQWYRWGPIARHRCAAPPGPARGYVSRFDDRLASRGERHLERVVEPVTVAAHLPETSWHRGSRRRREREPPAR